MDKMIAKVMKNGEKLAPVKSIKIKFQKAKRSSKKPANSKDYNLSMKHLNESVAFNKKHITDHKVAMKNGGSKDYNQDHIKHHQKDLKKDYKLIEKRQKDKAKGKIAKRTAKRLGPAKAKMMLKDNSAQGHKLTDKQKKLFQAVAHGFKPTKQRKTISIPKKELVNEHTKLVKTLKHGSKKQLTKEATKQSKELKEYKKKRLDPGTFGTKHMSQPDVYGKAMASATKKTQVFGAPGTPPKGMSFKQPSWANPKASLNKLKRAMKGYKR